jgi:phage gp29-like protein
MSNQTKKSMFDRVVSYLNKYNPYNPYVPLPKTPPLASNPINGGNASEGFSSIVTSARNVLIQSDIGMQSDPQQADEMLRDPSIMGPLNKRMLAVAQLKWEILPEDTSDKRQKLIVKKIEKIINDIPNLVDMFRQLQWAIWRGTGVVELSWVQNTNTNVWEIAKTRPHSGDKIRYDLWGNVRLMDTEHQTGGRELTKDELDALVIHTWNKDDGYFYDGSQAEFVFHGRGLRDTLYYYWTLGHNSLKFWTMMQERTAGGYWIARYPNNNEQAKLAMESVLQNLYQGTAVTLPVPSDPEEQAAFTLESIQMAGVDTTGQLYNDFVENYINKYIKLLIEGGSLTSSTGATGLGSNVADKHADSFQSLVSYDADCLADTLTAQLVEKIVRFNFAKLNFKPKFRFITEQSSFENNLKAIELAKSLGLEMSKDYLYEKLGIAAPQEGEELIIEPSHIAPKSLNKPIFEDTDKKELNKSNINIDKINSDIGEDTDDR